MAKKLFESEVVRLADLAIVNHVLDGFEFRDCLLLGPAVIVPMENVSFNNCNLGGDPSSTFWLIEAGRDHIVGAIGFLNSVFEGCQFQGIGFAGPEEVRQMLVEAIVPTQEGRQQ